MWCRNTVRASLHTSFFWGGDPFCEVVQRSENTHEELTGLLEWPAGFSLHLRDQQTSPLRIANSGSLSSVQNYRPYIVFQVPWTLPRIFLFMAGYRNLHTSGFFPGNLLILSAKGNICHSIHRQKIICFIILLYFLFPVTHFVDVILRPYWIC